VGLFFILLLLGFHPLVLATTFVRAQVSVPEIHEHDRVPPFSFPSDVSVMYIPHRYASNFGHQLPNNLAQQLHRICGCEFCVEVHYHYTMFPVKIEDLWKMRLQLRYFGEPFNTVYLAQGMRYAVFVQRELDD